jgi:hypothetical protein
VISEFTPERPEGRHVNTPLRAGKRFRLSLKPRPGSHVSYGFELVGLNLDPDRFGAGRKVSGDGQDASGIPAGAGARAFREPEL